MATDTATSNTLGILRRGTFHLLHRRTALPPACQGAPEGRELPGRKRSSFYVQGRLTAGTGPRAQHTSRLASPGTRRGRFRREWRGQNTTSPEAQAAGAAALPQPLFLSLSLFPTLFPSPSPSRHTHHGEGAFFRRRGAAASAFRAGARPARRPFRGCLVAEINGAAGVHEVEIKEKVEVVQEPGDHYDGEVPQLEFHNFANAKKEPCWAEENGTQWASCVRKPGFPLIRERNNLWNVQNQNLKLPESVTHRHHQNRKNPHLWQQCSCGTSKQISTYTRGLWKSACDCSAPASQAQRRHHP